MLTEQKELELVEVLKGWMNTRAHDYGYTLYEACLEQENCDSIFMDIFNVTFNSFQDKHNLSLDETIRITDKVVKDVIESLSDGGQDA